MSEINQTERVSDEELDQMIWKLERDGMTPKQLSLMREIREVRRAKGDGRDQFEEWFKFHHGDEGSIVTLHRANGGANYADPHVDLAWIAWKDSRAAVLNHSGDTADMVEPVSNRDELPTNSFTNEELAGMAHGDSPQANSYRELLGHRLNSPATPDGWKLVPVEPTAEMICSGIEAHFERSQIQIHDRPAPGPIECAYMAMVAAAPKEVG